MVANIVPVSVTLLASVWDRLAPSNEAASAPWWQSERDGPATRTHTVHLIR
jgi:hypothetical protein